MQLQRVCFPRNLEICCEWTPGELNVEPDYQSKKVQFDEYSLQRAIYYRLQRLWCSKGKRFTVDWFAGKWNKQSRRYCTFDKSRIGRHWRWMHSRRIGRRYDWDR
jgi:hypothetical protein